MLALAIVAAVAGAMVALSARDSARERAAPRAARGDGAPSRASGQAAAPIPDPAWNLLLERMQGERWRIAWPPVAGAHEYRLVIETDAGGLAYETVSAATETTIPDSALAHTFHKRPLSIHAEALEAGTAVRSSPALEISFGDDCVHE